MKDAAEKIEKLQEELSGIVGGKWISGRAPL